MTPGRLLRVTDFPKSNDISIASRETFSERATSCIDEVTGAVPSWAPFYPMPPATRIIDRHFSRLRATIREIPILYHRGSALG